MRELITSLEKRRRITVYVIVLFAFIAFIVSYNFQIAAPSYFEGKYNMYFANGLILYKIIELPILYYLLFHRYILKLKNDSDVSVIFPKIKKHTKLLFFLIPQGNTIFGIIAFKLSGNIIYFITFSFIAIMTLFLIKPNTLDI